MAKAFGFGKKEKLKSRKGIDALFAKGKSFAVFPIRVTYMSRPAGEEAPGAKVGVTASKRHFKRAVDRNRVKRLLREAYRLQKKELAEALARTGTTCDVFFMYTDKTIASYDTIFAAMTHCLRKLTQKMAVKNENPS